MRGEIEGKVISCKRSVPRIESALCNFDLRICSGHSHLRGIAMLCARKSLIEDLRPITGVFGRMFFIFLLLSAIGIVIDVCFHVEQVNQLMTKAKVASSSEEAVVYLKQISGKLSEIKANQIRTAWDLPISAPLKSGFPCYCEDFRLRIAEANFIGMQEILEMLCKSLPSDRHMRSELIEHARPGLVSLSYAVLIGKSNAMFWSFLILLVAAWFASHAVRMAFRGLPNGRI